MYFILLPGDKLNVGDLYFMSEIIRVLLYEHFSMNYLHNHSDTSSLTQSR